jgi:hypothetical protein
MIIQTEQFNANVLRYFDGPDPRGKGVIDSLKHTQIRNISGFWVYNYLDDTGARLGDMPRGAITGIGIDYDRSKKISVYSRLGSDTLFRTVALGYGGIMKKRFEYTLDEKQSEAAIELSENPLLFNEIGLFVSIDARDVEEVMKLKKQNDEISDQLQKDLSDIKRAQRAAWISARETFIG